MRNRSYILFYIGWGLAALLQVTFFSNMRINYAIPNVIIALMVLNLFQGKRDSVVRGMIAAGLFLDLFHTSFFGLATAVLSLIGVLMIWARQYYVRTNNLGVVFLSAVFASMLFDTVTILVTRSGDLSVWKLIVNSAIYTGVFTILGIGMLLLIGREFYDEVPQS